MVRREKSPEARWSVLLPLLALMLVACGADSTATGSGAVFGAPCNKSEDCASGLCVRRDPSGGICTSTCSDDSGCPASFNWGCVQPDGFASKVCACVPQTNDEICGDGVDNECNGRIDDCQKCNGQIVSLDDPQNCGMCGNACRPDQTCSLGVCGCPAQASFECNGVCANLETDWQNCGACGKSCPSGQVCSHAACACPDPSTPDYCAGSGCVDMQTSTTHCGSCNNSCPSPQVCTAGACTCPGGSNQKYCLGIGCVDLNTDVTSCGACGNHCQGDMTCVAGKCVCPASFPDGCGTSCVNFANDPDNCGGCGKLCPSDHACAASTCFCPSTAPNECNGACVNVQTDPDNCGTCGNACSSGQVCSSGACACSGYGVTTCNKLCVDIQTDPNNCGGCGVVCPATQICSAATCKCAIGQTWCAQANACVDLKTSSGNCGSCGNACNTGQSCVNGVCVCPLATQKFCASTGVCTDTASNDAHCGACDKPCPSGTSCQSSVCKCNLAGTTLCGTSCYDLQSDASHCGACTTACAGSMTCSLGKCGCPTPIVGTAVRLTTSPSETVAPAVAWNGTQLGVVYAEGKQLSSYSLSEANLRFTLVNSDGTDALPVDLDLTALAIPTDSVQSPPDIAWSGSEFAVVWRQYVSTSSPPSQIVMQKITPAGALKGGLVSITNKTPGTPLGTVAPRITWNAVYGGYALAAQSSSSVQFQRIGVDGSAPDSVNVTYVSVGAGRPEFAVSGTGEWAVGVHASAGYSLVFYNPDGSRTKPVSTLGASFEAGDVTHDGAAWASTWDYYSGVVVNRGDLPNAPYTAIPLSASSATFGDVRLASSGTGAFTFVWMQPKDIRLRRFLVPSTSSSTLTPLGTEVVLLPTQNAKMLTAAHAGSGSLIAVWPDDRWGATELYAAGVNFQSCP